MIGAGSRDGIVRILEDIVLGTITEVVEVGVKGWGKSTLVHLMEFLSTELPVRCARTYVVSLLLEPVERVLGTVRTVARCSSLNPVSRVSTTSAGELWCGQGNVRCRSSDVALESGHIIYAPADKSRCTAGTVGKKLTLFATAVGGVDPEPCAMAPSRRARRHSCGDLEIGEPGPYTRLVYAEDDKVLGFDGSDIGLVGNSEGASSQIVEIL